MSKLRDERRKKKKMPREIAEDVGFPEVNEMLRLVKSITDKIHAEVGDRFLSLYSSFGFILDINALMSTSNQKRWKHSRRNFYDTDLDVLEL